LNFDCVYVYLSPGLSVYLPHYLISSHATHFQRKWDSLHQFALALPGKVRRKEGRREDKKGNGSPARYLQAKAAAPRPSFARGLDRRPSRDVERNQGIVRTYCRFATRSHRIAEAFHQPRLKAAISIGRVRSTGCRTTQCPQSTSIPP